MDRLAEMDPLVLHTKFRQYKASIDLHCSQRSADLFSGKKEALPQEPEPSTPQHPHTNSSLGPPALCDVEPGQGSRRHGPGVVPRRLAAASPEPRGAACSPSCLSASSVREDDPQNAARGAVFSSESLRPSRYHDLPVRSTRGGAMKGPC